VVVVFKRTYKNHKNQTYHYKQSSCEIPAKPGVSRSWSGMSGHSVPKYPDIYPEYLSNYSPALSSESLNPSVRSIRIYNRSIRVPFSQRLFFCERGINTSYTPFTQTLLLISTRNAHKLKKNSLTPPFFILE
jgi:hypothetical protein